MYDNSYYIEDIIKNNEPCQSGIVISAFRNKKFDVFEISIELLKFNPYNDRIASYIKSEEYKSNNIDWFSVEGQKLISNFLWDSDIINNERSLNDILKNKQHTFAIIDKNGIVIDGNRRLCILKKICSDFNYSKHNINDFNKLKTVVIQNSLTQIEIMRLETEIQMGQDEKLDYQPIEKYLKVNKLIKQGFKETEIATLIKKDVKDINEFKKIYINMQNYLNFIDAPSEFSYIKKLEDHFIKLTIVLESMKKGKYIANWKYDENDIFDFQSIAFNFIRIGYEGKKFRSLLGSTTKKNGPFANEKIWKEFKEEIQTKNDKVEKDLNWRKDLEKKDKEIYYAEKLKKEFENSLKNKTAILEITNDSFKGNDLMQVSYESINKINEILEETKITPNFKKNFKKVKNLIKEIEIKLLKMGENND